MQHVPLIWSASRDAECSDNAAIAALLAPALLEGPRIQRCKDMMATPHTCESQEQRQESCPWAEWYTSHRTSSAACCRERSAWVDEPSLRCENGKWGESSKHEEAHQWDRCRLLLDVFSQRVKTSGCACRNMQANANGNRKVRDP